MELLEVKNHMVHNLVDFPDFPLLRLVKGMVQGFLIELLGAVHAPGVLIKIRLYHPGFGVLNPYKKKAGENSNSPAFFLYLLRYSIVHRQQKFFIRRSTLHTVSHKFHCLYRIHIGQVSTQYPHTVECVFR